MIPIIYWKDLVGEKFMPTFQKITKALYWAGKTGTPAEKVMSKFNDKDVVEYREKMSFMRVAGIDDDGKRYGWYAPYLAGRDNELRFMCTLPLEERKYVSVMEFMKIKTGEDADRLEDEYYGSVGYQVGTVMQNMGKTKRQDPDFPEENE